MFRLPVEWTSGYTPAGRRKQSLPVEFYSNGRFSLGSSTVGGRNVFAAREPERAQERDSSYLVVRALNEYVRSSVLYVFGLSGEETQ